MKKPLPGKNISDRFSFKTLLQDYADFISNRREKMVWGGQQISNIQMLNLERNKIGTASTLLSDFSTAAEQLKLETKFNKSENQYAPKYKASKQSIKSNVQVSPQRSYAPTSGIRRSPSPKKIFAPPIYNRESPTKMKHYISNNKSVKPSDQLKSGVGNTSDHCDESKSNRKLQIDVSKRLFPLKKENSFEYLKPVKIEDVTASEILHNPQDLVVDNRPIIANAKLLADAIIGKKKQPKPIIVKRESQEEVQNKSTKVRTKKDKPSKMKKSSTKRSKKDEKTDVKREVSSTQFDIFSQLSRAKKKPKIKDNEIIIIDD